MQNTISMKYNGNYCILMHANDMNRGVQYELLVDKADGVIYCGQWLYIKEYMRKRHSAIPTQNLSLCSSLVYVKHR